MTFSMRRAVIDIGSNTVKLLVAEVSDGLISPVISKSQTTRLGENLNQTGRLAHSAIDRSVDAIGQFADNARSLGATDVIAVSTSAVREAGNRDKFTDAVWTACRLDVQVLTGQREAELIFRGVCTDPAFSRERILVMDIGGGSAEFILGQAGQIERAQSLRLGAVRLTEQFAGKSFAELAEALRTELHAELAGLECETWRMIGTGGTITTLAKVLGHEPDHACVSQEKMRAIVAQLDAMSLEERRQVPGLPADRADIIVAGGAVALFAMERLGALELTVSTRGLRHGILA
jgi:exopolyphosphatase/guanosine-5'-triphosphate,3'-diphosphate pyrophosphatase